MEQSNAQPDNWHKKIVTQSFSRFPEKRQQAERDIWIDGVNFGAIEKQVEYEGKFKQADNENAALQAKVDRYEAALKVVRDWKLPSTGKYWHDSDSTPMSYEACYGSNGVRDFMRNVANEALSAGDGEKEVANG